MNRKEFISDVAALVAELIPTIADDYRAYDDCGDSDSDGVPSMLLTIGADADGWLFQTGDTSYSGGAYHYATWGQSAIYRDSVPADVAEAIANDLRENESDASDARPIFEDSHHE